LAAPLALLAGMLSWWSPRKDDRSVAARPTLERIEPIVLRAGHDQTVTIRVNCQSAAELLTVRVEGLPPEVDFVAASLPPGDGLGEARLRLTASPEAKDFAGQVKVLLEQGSGGLDEQNVRLTVTPFLRPHIEKILPLPPLVVEPGKMLLVQAEVKANGNTDPWSLRIDGLPPGVHQRPPAGPVPPGRAAVEIVADATAREKLEITRVVLLADGVVAHRETVPLSVEYDPRDVRIGLVLPASIQIPRGGKSTITVELMRNGFAGALRLALEDLPTGVRADPVSVPAAAQTAVVELRCDEDNAPRLALHAFRVVALVGNKVVGSRNGRLRVEQAGEARTPPGKPAVGQYQLRPGGDL
jgi:hypothetical protein